MDIRFLMSYFFIVWHKSKTNFTQIGLSNMLRPLMDTLKFLHVGTSICDQAGCDDFVAGLSFELEAMKSNNIIETVSIDVCIDTDADCKQIDIWGRLDAALTQSGWAKLQRVSLRISIFSYRGGGDEMGRLLKGLLRTQFPRLSSSQSLVFEFAVGPLT